MSSDRVRELPVREMLLKSQAIPGELGKDLHRSIATKCKQPRISILRHNGWRLAESHEIGRDRTAPDVVSPPYPG